MAIVLGKITPFTSAARTATANSDDIVAPSTAKGVRLFLDITAASGSSPTLDVKVQAKDPLGGLYVDMVGAAFAQQNSTANLDLVIYPGVAASSNRRVSDIIPKNWRVVATLGGSSPNFTFSVLVEYLPIGGVG
tara:strand:- start:184 stop:585 length:402 start_codon:yes stop_codon:yes gene_type:complete